MTTFAVDGDNITTDVSDLVNGTDASYYFETIPSYMLEVPFKASSYSNGVGNVEVFVDTQDGADVLKAVCDMSPTNDETDYFGYNKAAQEQCAFNYATNVQHVTNYTLTGLDPTLTQIDIYGMHFMLANETKMLTVSIADYPCNITFFDDSHIICTVDSVPYGLYQPLVSIRNIGDSIMTTNRTLKFKQYIYSMYPIAGSMAGGQIVTIQGRGFRFSVRSFALIFTFFLTNSYFQSTYI